MTTTITVRNRRTTPVEVRFFAKLDTSAGPDGCHLWTGGTTNEGYGRIYLDPETGLVLTHRLAFYLAHGYWPQPFCLHSCDTPTCCNPLHLREGTHTENMAEASARLRMLGNRKISVEQAAAVRDLVRAGALSQRQIASLVGLSPSQISRIASGQRWANFLPPNPLDAVAS